MPPATKPTNGAVLEWFTGTDDAVGSRKTDFDADAVFDDACVFREVAVASDPAPITASSLPRTMEQFETTEEDMTL
jgi:hypothetical protein